MLNDDELEAIVERPLEFSKHIAKDRLALRKKLDYNPEVHLLVLRKEDLPELIERINETFHVGYVNDWKD